MKKRLPLIIVLICIVTGCAREGSLPPPSQPSSSTASSPLEQMSQPAPVSQPKQEADNTWRLDSPENHNMNPDVFTQLHDALSASTVYSMVTAKDGVIIDEYYKDGYDQTSTFALHSCSKSFTSALVGIAQEQGLIKSIDDPLSDYLPQVLALTDTRKQQITLRHLLTHTSGLEWYEWGGSYSNWEEFRAAPNWIDYILTRNLVSQPGTSFNYSTGNTHLLTAALEQAVGMGAMDYARQNLFDPLGMDSVEWGSDPQGIVDGGNGISMSARDAARFGQLFLDGGVWNGKQLIPPEWLAESTTAQNSGAGDGTGSYGLSWWTRSFGAGNYDTYYAFGAWGQFLFVVPELDLVTVIASQGPQGSYVPRPFFTDYVLAAYKN